MALRPTTPQSRKEQLAAREEAQQDVFMREVDEAVRQDQVSHFARRFGFPIAGALTLGLAAFGGWLWYHESRKAEAEQDAVEMTLALDRLQAGQADAALEKLAPLEGSDFSAYSASARMLQAGIALQKGDAEKAARLYDAVAANAEAPGPMRDLATLRAVAANFDAMNPQEVVDRLKPLAAPGNPFFPSAGELVAIAYIELGKPELAGPLLAEIVRNEDTPDSLKARARQLAGVLGTDAVDDPQEIVETIARRSAARQ